MQETTCIEKQPLSQEMLEKMDAYWRAANYLSAGQLYLLDDPLLRKPLTMEHIKKKIVGHWGTVPGQNFVYVHCNRAIKRYDLDMILLSGPGHGGNFLIANTYLDGSYSEVYPNISRDEEGMKKLFKQFSFPCGVPSHCANTFPAARAHAPDLPKPEFSNYRNRHAHHLFVLQSFTVPLFITSYIIAHKSSCDKYPIRHTGQPKTAPAVTKIDKITLTITETTRCLFLHFTSFLFPTTNFYP